MRDECRAASVRHTEKGTSIFPRPGSSPVVQAVTGRHDFTRALLSFSLHRRGQLNRQEDYWALYGHPVKEPQERGAPDALRRPSRRVTDRGTTFAPRELDPQWGQAHDRADANLEIPTRRQNEASYKAIRANTEPRDCPDGRSRRRTAVRTTSAARPAGGSAIAAGRLGLRWRWSPSRAARHATLGRDGASIFRTYGAWTSPRRGRLDFAAGRPGAPTRTRRSGPSRAAEGDRCAFLGSASSR